MRAHYQLKRLFVPDNLHEDAIFAPTKKQTHYLLHVLRLTEGDEVLLFNGRDGEWRASLFDTNKRSTRLKCLEQTRVQSTQTDLELMFAPLKTGRMDYLIQKSVEMGVGVLSPVQTEFTQNSRVAEEKFHAYIEEAAEQCGILSLPHLNPLEKLTATTIASRNMRRIIFCDEDTVVKNPIEALSVMTSTEPVTLLIGPEGGFSDPERIMIRQFDHVSTLSLGPRILRADTATVAALALIQSSLGDWRATI